MRKYVFIIAAAFLGACIGALGASRLCTPHEVQHGSGFVTVFPKSSLGVDAFYTVGNNVFCDDIILENGEVALHNHPYSVTFTKRDTLNGRVFTGMCHLGDPA